MLPSSRAPEATAFSRFGIATAPIAGSRPNLSAPLGTRSATPLVLNPQDLSGMTDTKNPGDKTLHMSPKTLSLKRSVEQGMVRQSFSHGRSKAVVVETVKRRAATPGQVEKPVQPAASAAPRGAAAPAAGAAQGRARPAAVPSNAPRSGVVLRTLSDQERDARASALADARRREEEDRRSQEDEAKRRADRDVREAKEREAAEARKRDEEERRRQEDDRKRRAEDE